MIELYGKQNCGYCTSAMQLLESNGMEYKKYIIDENISREEFVSKFPDVRTVPLICIDGEKLGGYQALKEYVEVRK
jgi:glutaredoxin